MSSFCLPFHTSLLLTLQSSVLSIKRIFFSAEKLFYFTSNHNKLVRSSVAPLLYNFPENVVILLQEIGLLDSVAEMNKPATTGTNLPAVPKPRKRKTYHIEVETRRSTRLQGAAPEGFTDEDYLRRMGIDRLDLLAPMRRRRVNVDPETLKRLREERMAGGQGEEAGFDSGAGVRIQGGRVYDSVRIDVTTLFV